MAAIYLNGTANACVEAGMKHGLNIRRFNGKPGDLVGDRELKEGEAIVSFPFGSFPQGFWEDVRLFETIDYYSLRRV